MEITGEWSDWWNWNWPAALIAAVVFCPGWAGAAEEAKQRDKRPNIIFLLADDMRWDAAGFAGNKVARTPHLDELAARGTIFDSAFVTTSICAVSRASILAGQYARRTGIQDFATQFTPEQWAQCYPELLRAAGYRMGFIGKFGVGRAAPTNSFEYWDGFNGQGRYFEGTDREHLTSKMGTSALRFLDSGDGRPFCLSISFKAPHAQDGDLEREFPPDPRDEELYADAAMPAGPLVSEEAFRKLPEFLQRSEARRRWEFRFATDEMRERTVKDYYRLISGIDREVGRIIDELRALGLEDDTVIIFTSDNGFYLGERGLAGKWFMHEESIRVPLVVFDPAAKSPVRTGALALNIDLAPTILDYAGVPIPGAMQGRSLRDFARGTPREWRDDFFYEHHFEYGGRIPSSEGVRGERWKYVRYVNIEPPVEMLHDLERDPLEQHNLAGEPSLEPKLAEMRARWRELRTELE